MAEKSYTTKQAAALLGVTPARVRQRVMRNQLRATKFGRDLMIRHSDLKPWLAARRARENAKRKEAA